MKRFPFLVFAVLVLSWALAFWALAFWASASAQDKRQPSPGSKGVPASTTVISPIFGQLFGFSMPANFKVVREKGNADVYSRREAVLAGETVERWMQMITVQAVKAEKVFPGLNPAAVTPQFVASYIVRETNESCPETFTAYAFGDTKIDGYDAVMFITACGNLKADDGQSSVADGGERSEMALFMVIKGATAYYMLQWTERDRAMDSAPKIDVDKWKQRVAALQPLRLCAIVPGEKPPYPSCLNEK